MPDTSEDKNSTPKTVVSVRNSGEPILVSGLKIDGISAEAAESGATVKIWTRLSLTSDAPIFHKIAKSLADQLDHCVRKSDKSIDLSSANKVLLVIKPDKDAELWIDNFAILAKVVSKRDLEAGGTVFEHDIADIVSLTFPCIQIRKTDRIVYLFREGWRFGLFLDFNLETEESLARAESDIASLYRALRYRIIYDAVSKKETFDNLVNSGWFPFAEILGEEFEQLAALCSHGLSLDEMEKKLITKFDSGRLERIFNRWMARPHFSGKQRILRSAIRTYLDNDPVAVLKITLTEIEGILNEAYHAIYGKGAKLNVLLDFAVRSVEEKRGNAETLMFPEAFGRYLSDYTFANFDPKIGNGVASSRHAVGHGAAASDSYTQVRALQALLTLDQLAFFT